MNGSIIQVAKAADGGLRMLSLGRSVAIGFPFPETAEAAQMLAPGVAAKQNSRGFATAVVAKTSGSVQVATVIQSTTSPQRYTYALTLPEGVALHLYGETVIASDSAGNYYASVLPAWAVDAQGREVPTWYEVEGSLLTQVVAHDSSMAYPIVADPWFGIDLWVSTSTNRNGPYLGQPVYSGVLSPHGWLIYTGMPTWGFPGGIPAGQIIIRTAAWDELKTKLPGVSSKATLLQQYSCHVSYGYAFWLAGFHWDLEKARADYPGWNSNPNVHRCNW